MRITHLWTLVLGLLGLFLIMLVLATRSAGALTWHAVLSAALTTLWWGVLIYLGLVRYRAFRRWQNGYGIIRQHRILPCSFSWAINGMEVCGGSYNVSSMRFYDGELGAGGRCS